MRVKRELVPEPAAEVVEPGSARYFAWLYADAGRRELLSTLLGIEREIESSLRPGLEHQVAHMRLAWWREECDRFARGTPVHPTTRRLLPLAGSCTDAVKLHGLVDSVAWDLAAAPCETRNALEQHCERWADAVIVPFAVCGPNAVRADAALAQSARGAGRALREIELLLRLAPDARRGRLRLPLDELDSLGIEPRALANPPWPEPLNAWMRQRYEALRGSLRGAFATLDPLARRETSALAAWCAVAAASAARAVRSLPDARPDRRLDRIANAVHAWRAARAALRGRSPHPPSAPSPRARGEREG